MVGGVPGVHACHVCAHIYSAFRPPTCAHVPAGEKVVIRAKFKPDIIVPNWRAMFCMAGNESFTTREQANAGNRLTRRTVAYCFGKKVLEHDRALLERMREEMPLIIWICSWALKVRPSTSCISHL